MLKLYKAFGNIDEVVEIGASLEEKKPLEDTKEISAPMAEATREENL